MTIATVPSPPTSVPGEAARARRRPDGGTLLRWSVLAAIVAVALVVRWQFVDVRTLDFNAFLDGWYNHIADAGGFSAFKEKFADYNYPYLYLIAILTYLHIPALVGVKAISVIFDIVLASFAYRIVGLRYPQFWVRALVFGLILGLPTVIANSSYWGQADVIYSAFAVGGFYFLLRKRPWSACIFFGLAISFKLQAIFIFPVLLWLVLRRYVPVKALLAIPAVYLLLDVPALLVGAPWKTVLSVYLEQTDSYKQLTLGAPNVYQLLWLDGDLDWVAYTGIGVAAAIIVVFLGWSVWRRPPVTATTILVTATASAVLVPFLLPAMHERYFYLAEVLSVIVAFYLPMRFWIIPVLIQMAGLGVYYASLTGDQAGMAGGFGGGGGGRPGGGAANGTPPSGTTPDATAPGGNTPNRAGMGGPGGGTPGGRTGGMGGGGSRSGGSYTSGRGDTALSIYAGVMGLALLTVLYALVDTFRKVMYVKR